MPESAVDWDRLFATVLRTVSPCCGGFLLLCGSYFCFVSQKTLLHDRVNLDRLKHVVRDESCSPAMDSNNFVEAPEVIHLSGCHVKGLANFTPDGLPEYPGLQNLVQFAGYLPAHGIVGAWFRVHVQQRYEWCGHYCHKHWGIHSKGNDPHSAKGFERLHLPTSPVTADHRAIRIGEFHISRDVLLAFPASPVPLSQNPVQKEASSISWQVANGMLWSGSPDDPRIGDLRVWFEVGAADVASVIAAIGKGVDLIGIPSHLQDVHLGNVFDVHNGTKTYVRVERGSVSAGTMLGHAAEEYTHSVWIQQLALALLNLLGTILLLQMLFARETYTSIPLIPPRFAFPGWGVICAFWMFAIQKFRIKCIWLRVLICKVPMPPLPCWWIAICCGLQYVTGMEEDNSMDSTQSGSGDPLRQFAAWNLSAFIRAGVLSMVLTAWSVNMAAWGLYVACGPFLLLFVCSLVFTGWSSIQACRTAGAREHQEAGATYVPLPGSSLQQLA